MGWLVLVGAIGSWSVVWVGLTVLAARLLGAAVAEARVGLGPSRSVGRWANCDWRVGVLPLGAYVRAVDDAPVPLMAGVGPALVLGLLGAAVAPDAADTAIRGFLVPLFTLGTPEPPGLLLAFAAAADAAATDPIGAGFGTWAVLGLFNVVNGGLQGLTRFGPAGVVAYALIQLVWLGGLVRGLVLDVWGP